MSRCAKCIDPSAGVSYGRLLPDEADDRYLERYGCVWAGGGEQCLCSESGCSSSGGGTIGGGGDPLATVGAPVDWFSHLIGRFAQPNPPAIKYQPNPGVPVGQDPMDTLDTIPTTTTADPLAPKKRCGCRGGGPQLWPLILLALLIGYLLAKKG